MDKATQKSIEWQKANNPMAIGGDAFADMVNAYNVNPAFVAGYKEAEKDILEKIEKQINLWLSDNPEVDEYVEGKRLAFRSVLVLLKEWRKINHELERNQTRRARHDPEGRRG